MGTRVLVVDDEESICIALRGALSKAGYEVATALSGQAALRHLAGQRVDVALVDLKMEGMDGLTLIQEISRCYPGTVIIMLTAHASVEAALAASRTGAHDYLIKPVRTEQLVLTIERGLDASRRERRRREMLEELEVLIQRLQGEEAGVGASSSRVALGVLEAGELRIDFARHEVSWGGAPVSLTPMEYKLLACLAEEPGVVLDARTLVERVQGYECEEWEARDLIRWHIHNLRRKIEPDPGEPRYIVTIWGVGYTFKVDG